MQLCSSLLALITMPLSLIWGSVAWLRGWMFNHGWLHSHRYPLPIICVGNLSVGGTGKTPHVEYLLHLLHNEGWQVAMLSRGYGRRTKGYILADATRHTAADIGDEPFQMMHNCPFATIAVCENRCAGIEHLLKLQPLIDVIVLDDAYQHRYVQAGYNVLLTDAHRLYTYDHLLPWGRLREPASAAKRAQAIVVTKCLPHERPQLQTDKGQQLFYSHIVYNTLLTPDMRPLPQPLLQGQNILLIVGIANPAPLVKHLQQQGANVVVAAFADHHTFNSKDVQRINDMWQQHACTIALTTQKDMTRLLPVMPQLNIALADNLLVQPISVQIESVHTQPNDLSFNQTIIQYVRTNQRNRSLD